MTQDLTCKGYNGEAPCPYPPLTGAHQDHCEEGDRPAQQESCA